MKLQGVQGDPPSNLEKIHLKKNESSGIINKNEHTFFIQKGEEQKCQQLIKNL